MPISMLAPGAAANKSFECRSFNVYVSSDDGIISNVVNFDVTDLLNMGCTFIGSTNAGLDNFTATTAPTTSDDSANGYAAGSRWLNNNTGLLYTCIDASNNAAVWVINASIVNNTLELGDNLANALDFAEDGSSYLKFVTTNGQEKVEINKLLAIALGVDFTGGDGVNIINLQDNLSNALEIKNGASSLLKFVTTDLNEAIVCAVDFSLSDGRNIAFKTTTGTKIGTDASQKMAFFGATPVAQQATAGTTTGFTAGSGTAANDDSTYTGGTGTAAYTVGDIVLALKTLGFMAA